MPYALPAKPAAVQQETAHVLVELVAAEAVRCRDELWRMRRTELSSTIQPVAAMDLLQSWAQRPRTVVNAVQAVAAANHHLPLLGSTAD